MRQPGNRVYKQYVAVLLATWHYATTDECPESHHQKWKLSYYDPWDFCKRHLYSRGKGQRVLGWRARKKVETIMKSIPATQVVPREDPLPENIGYFTQFGLGSSVATMVSRRVLSPRHMLNINYLSKGRISLWQFCVVPHNAHTVVSTSYLGSQSLKYLVRREERPYQTG